jgi:flagella basal body P-ring formation protein FlgA
VSYRTPTGVSGLIRIRIHRYAETGPRPPLPMGRVVKSRPYALRSGERIRIRFVRGAVTVAVPGRAFRSGYEGDTVPVRPYDSQERFEGVIVGPKEVLVDLQ